MGQEEQGSSRDHAHTAGGVRELADPVIRALYSPALGQVGCVLIQAAFGGDRRACNIFSARDWFVAPAADMVWITEPASAWEAVAAMPKAERLALFKRGRPDADTSGASVTDPGMNTDQPSEGQ